MLSRAELIQDISEAMMKMCRKHTIDHTTLGQSPRNTFLEGMVRTGSRAHRLIPHDEAFIMWTLPTTPKGNAKVLPGRGFKIHHLYYWSDALRDPDVENSQVDVRYDPFDIAAAFAFVGARWIRCYSEYYSVFHGRSERELMIATKELRAQRSNHSRQFTISAKKLADFLESVEAEEAMLMQRLRDSEGHNVLEAINGEPAELTEPVTSARISDGDNAGDQNSKDDDTETLEVYEDF